MGYLIDDTGNEWDEGSATLRRKLNAIHLGTEEFRDYAIRNLGFVHVSFASSGTLICLRPQVVAQPAIAGVFYRLYDLAPRRIAITVWGESKVQVCIGVRSAIAVISGLSDKLFENRTEDFHRRRVPLAKLPKRSKLGSLLDAWQHGARPADLKPTLCDVVGNKFAIVEASGSDRSQLILREIGEGLVLYDASWRSLARGRRFEDQPDLAYARWVAETYREVAKAAHPILEEVDAIVERPQHGRRRHRYRRVVLPFGGSLLLGATDLDASVDLRRSSLGT